MPPPLPRFDLDPIFFILTLYNPLPSLSYSTGKPSTSSLQICLVLLLYSHLLRAKDKCHLVVEGTQAS